ncbi:hypothetical protein [Clostridium merdae]|uniref:hypothetical protein n=1 Tax=Clostridium merdae TaxID=1958780 RepID=UPI00164E12E6|nr:hypothetical protein [Clostridium merdae]
MAKKAKITSRIPEHEIEALARCLLPEILAFYESEEGKEEFNRWKPERNQIICNNTLKQ